MDKAGESIETKEIRGLNFKNLWAIATSTATIILFVWRIMAGYSEKTQESFQSIQNRLLILEQGATSGDKIIDIRLRQLETRMDAIEQRVEDNTKFRKTIEK